MLLTLVGHVLARADAQHLHARRARARRRPPRRRLHRGAREHQPAPQHAGQAARASRCSTPPAKWPCPSSCPRSPPSWSSCRRSSWRARRKLLFIPLTFTISFSLFASFLVSRTVTPLLCLRWLERRRSGGAAHPVTRALAWSGRMLERLDEAYQRALGWALGHPKTLIGGILALCRDGGGDPAAHRHRVLPALGREPVHHPRSGAGGHAGGGDRADRRPHGGRSSGPTLAPSEFTSIVSTVGRAVGPVGRLLAEYRAPRGAAPGVPGRSRQAEAQ